MVRELLRVPRVQLTISRETTLEMVLRPGVRLPIEPVEDRLMAGPIEVLTRLRREIDVRLDLPAEVYLLFKVSRQSPPDLFLPLTIPGVELTRVETRILHCFARNLIYRHDYLPPVFFTHILTTPSLNTRRGRSRKPPDLEGVRLPLDLDDVFRNRVHDRSILDLLGHVLLRSRRSKPSFPGMEACGIMEAGM